MDRFTALLGLLRRGQTDAAARLTTAEPGAWLPRWAAGEPLSPGLRQVHGFRGAGAVHLDATHAWVLTSSDTIHRIDRTDGTVDAVPLRARPGLPLDAVFTGGTVVTMAEDRVLVWDARTGELLVTTDPADIPVRAGKLTAIDVAGTVAVTGTAKGHLLRWDLTDGRRLAKATTGDGSVTRVAVSADAPGRVLSVGTGPRATVRYWTLDELRHLGGTGAPATRAAWTSLDDTRRAVTVDEDGLLRIWDPRASPPVATFATGVRAHGALTFAGAAAVLASGRLLRIVDLTTGAALGTLRTDLDHDARHVAVHGRTVAAATTGGRVNLLDLDALEAIDPTGDRLVYHAAVPTAAGIAAIAGDGLVRHLATGDGLVRHLAAGDGLPLRAAADARRVRAGPRRLLRLTVDGRETLVAVEGTGIAVLDPDGTVRRPATPSPFGVVLWSAAADGTGPVPLVAALDPGGNIAVWDVRAVRLHASRPGARNSLLRRLALGAGTLLTAAADGQVQWLDPDDLTETRPPTRFSGPVTALGVLGPTVAVAAGGTVTTHDIRGGQQVGPPLAHPGTVRALLATTAGGAAVVVTGCDDRTLRVWDPTTGTCLEAFPAPLRVDRVIDATPDRITVLTDGVLVQLARS